MVSKKSLIITVILAALLISDAFIFYYFWYRKSQAGIKTTTQRVLSFVKKPISSAANIKNKVKEFDISSVILAIVKIECYFGDETDPRGGGSGVLASFRGDPSQPVVLTNAHVVRDEINNLATGCWAYLPRPDGTFYDSAYWAGSIESYDNIIVSMGGYLVGGVNFDTGGTDYAVLRITGPGQNADGLPVALERNFPDIDKIIQATCPEDREIKIGEKVYILGYPSIGGSSMTVTEGIISGFRGVFNEFVKTSAKIEQGNSGGLAVLAKDGCLLGIPSLSYIGSLESIGAVLKYSFIKDFINSLSVFQ